MDGKISKAYRNALAAGLCFSMLAEGLAVGFVGPTLIDMKNWLGVGDAEMGYVPAAQAIGVLASSLAMSRIYRLLRRDRAIILAYVLFAVTSVLTPLIRNYYVYVLIGMLSQACVLAMDLGAFVWTVELFSESNSTPLQLISLMYSLGVFAASFIAPFFVSNESDSDDQLTAVTSIPRNSTPAPAQNGTWIVVAAQDFSGVRYLFSIAAGVLLVQAVYLSSVQIWFHYFSQPIKPKVDDHPVTIDKKVDSLNEAQPPELKFRYKVWAVFWSTAIMSTEIGVEINTGTYMVTTLHKKGFSKWCALNANTYGMGALAFGRLMSIFTSTKLPAKSLVVIHTSLYMVSGAAMFFTLQHPDMEYLTIIAISFLNIGYSANMAAQFSYIDSRVRLTDSIAGVLYAMSAIINFCDPLIIGQLISNTPTILLIVIVSHGCLTLTAFFVLEASFRHFKRKPERYFKLNPLKSKAELE